MSPALVAAVALLACAARAEHRKQKQFPLYDYPPYEGVCEDYSEALARLDPAYGEQVQLTRAAARIPGRAPLMVLSELRANLTRNFRFVSGRHVRGRYNQTHMEKRFRVLSASELKDAQNNVMTLVVAEMNSGEKQCIRSAHRTFEDVYIASNLLKACEEGSFMATRKSGAYICKDACPYPTPQYCEYFKACVQGCVEELKLSLATTNDDLAHQIAINPDGVFNVKRDPGDSPPHALPMIPAALEHKQTPNAWPPLHNELGLERLY